MTTKKATHKIEVCPDGRWYLTAIHDARFWILKHGKCDNDLPRAWQQAHLAAVGYVLEPMAPGMVDGRYYYFTTKGA